ncbi:MAG: sulfatase-like hydrolase/transferase [Planctomycetes bacterium]|nr:sulfatase-like hydrolase/transferase [Planctomycetota bacterium]
MPSKNDSAAAATNIVLITTDQHRYDSLGITGNSKVRTPNIDALASRGVLFSRAFVQNTVCVPSRACLQTGRYTHQHGVRYMETAVDDTPGLPPWETTFMERLQTAGRRTGVAGKIHMYPDKGFDFRRITGGKGSRWTMSTGQKIGPGPLGNDYAAWLEQKCPGAYEKIYEQRRRKEYRENHTAIVNDLPLEQYVEWWTKENSVEFIEDCASKDQPFFLWCGFCGPHGPFDPPASHAKLYDPADMPVSEIFAADVEGKPRIYQSRSFKNPSDTDAIKLVTARYYALVTLIDDMISEITSALERSGVLEQTLIIFTSDHGEMLGDFGRLGKGVFHDSSMHVPLIIVPPGGRRADVPGVVDHLTEMMDVCPTILDYAGARIPDYMEAVSLRSAVEGGGRSKDLVLSEYTINDKSFSGKCIRTDRYKYVYWTDDIGEFYDLKEDPHELTNLWADPARAKDVRRHEQLLLEKLVKSERPIPPK